MFRIAAQDDASGLFRLDADEETQRVYPFDFRLDMAFAVEGVSLSMTATVMNRGSEDMPFSFGFHPAFAWPLPYGGKKEEHRVLFERDEPAPLRKVGIEPGLISHKRVPSPVRGNALAPTHAMFGHDALIWDDLNSRRLKWGAPGHPLLDIAFPDTPWLGLWQKRSEEHTSELQSLMRISYAVFCLKKKKNYCLSDTAINCSNKSCNLRLELRYYADKQLATVRVHDHTNHTHTLLYCIH